MFAFCGQLLFAMLALALAVSADGSSGAADKGTDSLLGVADTNVPSATVPEVEDGIEEGQRTLPEAALMMEPESEEGVEEEGEEGEEGYEGYFGIPTLIEAMNNDAASVPMFVYFMVGIVLALAVGVPALAVIRWKRKGGKFSMFTDSKYEQLTSDQVGIEDADDAVYTRGPTIGPNSPQNMRIRSPSSRNDHSHSPERSHLSTIRMKVPSSPGRDIDF